MTQIRVKRKTIEQNHSVVHQGQGRIMFDVRGKGYIVEILV